MMDIKKWTDDMLVIFSYQDSLLRGKLYNAKLLGTKLPLLDIYNFTKISPPKNKLDFGKWVKKLLDIFIFHDFGIDYKISNIVITVKLFNHPLFKLEKKDDNLYMTSIMGGTIFEHNSADFKKEALNNFGTIFYNKDYNITITINDIPVTLYLDYFFLKTLNLLRLKNDQFT